MREANEVRAWPGCVWALGCLCLVVSTARAYYIDNSGSCSGIATSTNPYYWACEDFDDYAKSGWLSTASAAELVNQADWVKDTAGPGERLACPNEWQVYDDRPSSSPYNVRVQKNADYPAGDSPPPGSGARNLLNLVPRIQEINPAKGALNGTDDNPLVLYFEAYPATSSQVYYRQNFVVELNNGLDVAPAEQITLPCPHIALGDGKIHSALAFGIFAQTDQNPCPVPEYTRIAIYDGLSWKGLDAGAFANLPDQLLTIDPATGVGTLRATILGYNTTQGLAFDPNTNTLYCSVADNNPLSYDGQLIKIDTATGVATLVGSLGTKFIRGLAFDPNTNTLYGSNWSSSYLVRIDTATGAATEFPNPINGLTPTLTGVEGLAFDPATGTLYGIATGPNPDQVITIDTTTGYGYLLGEGDLYTKDKSCRDISPDTVPDADMWCPGMCGGDCDIYPRYCYEINSDRFNSVKGLEFANGKLYATDTAMNELIEINTDPTVRTQCSTWSRVTRLGNKLGFSDVEGLAFDPNTGTMYGINQNASPPEDVTGSYAWNRFTISVKTNSITVHLTNKDVDSPFDFTVPRAYIGAFATLAIGNSGCISSPYTMDLDTISLRGGVLADSIYPNGACCERDGTCNPDVDQNVCRDRNGQFLGPGVACDGSVLCCPDPFADADGDGDVDQADFSLLQTCILYTAPIGKCKCFDRDSNQTVNDNDYGQFELCATGSGIPFDYNNRPYGCDR